MELCNLFNQLVHESQNQFEDQHRINERLHQMMVQAQSLAQQAHQSDSIPLFVAGGGTVQMGSSSQGWYSDEQRTNDDEQCADEDECYEETVHDTKVEISL